MVIKQKLRPYQIEVGRAILDSVFNRKGMTFSVEIARQGGKNELSAQIEILLLTMFMNIGGNAIKCSPTFKPQTLTSMMRLEERLDAAGYSSFWSREHGNIVRVGKARQVFLSADRSSSVVGATAHILLEVDESQDVAKVKYAREFRPMGASTNVTTVLWGTTWDSTTLLEEIKQSNLELERKDGLKRHFRYDWQQVARFNPHYLTYVEGERARLGENHPLFQTQYCLNPVGENGRFLNYQQKAQLAGIHSRMHRPVNRNSIYIAGIDLAGEIEEVKSTGFMPAGKHRDSTVVTIGELDFLSGDKLDKQPRINIVEHYYWTGKPHTSQYQQLVDVIKNIWNCRSVVVDATGIGYGVAAFLTETLGKATVTSFIFTAQSKSRLGFELLAAINSGRLKMYANDDSIEYGEFRMQIDRAKSNFRPSQTMNFFVDPSEGHDDFLISTALLVEAAGYRPRSARGHVGAAQP